MMKSLIYLKHFLNKDFLLSLKQELMPRVVNAAPPSGPPLMNQQKRSIIIPNELFNRRTMAKGIFKNIVNWTKEPKVVETKRFEFIAERFLFIR